MFDCHPRRAKQFRVTDMAFSKSKAKGGNGFEDRLARIHKGGANTMGEIQVGPREEIRAGSKSKPSNTVRMKKKKMKKKEVGRASGMSLFLLAFVFGAFSMFVGQVANFHMFVPGGLTPINLTETAIAPYLPYANLIIGGVLALMFAWTFRLMTMMRIIATVAGLFVVVQYHTEMVEFAPGTHAKFFSKPYVKEVRANARSARGAQTQEEPSA